MAAWLFWTLVTIFTWGVWAILSKFLAEEIASPAHSQAVSTLGILPVLAMLWAMEEPSAVGNRTSGILLALGSGVVSCLGNIAYFDVLSRGAKAAAVVPLTALYPMVTVLLAVPILHEQLNGIQCIGICVSLVAIYLFNVRGEQSYSSTWLILALIPIMLWGLCGLLQKMSTSHISARSSAIWFLVAFLPVAAFILTRNRLPSGVRAKTWVLAAAVGFTLALGNFTILLAFSSGGKASIIAPLAGLYPLVSIPIAIAAFGERLNGREKLGILCALVAVVMLSYQPEQATPSGANPEMGISP